MPPSGAVRLPVCPKLLPDPAPSFPAAFRTSKANGQGSPSHDGDRPAPGDDCRLVQARSQNRFTHEASQDLRALRANDDACGRVAGAVARTAHVLSQNGGSTRILKRNVRFRCATVRQALCNPSRPRAMHSEEHQQSTRRLPFSSPRRHVRHALRVRVSRMSRVPSNGRPLTPPPPRRFDAQAHKARTRGRFAFLASTLPSSEPVGGKFASAEASGLSHRQDPDAVAGDGDLDGPGRRSLAFS